MYCDSVLAAYERQFSRTYGCAQSKQCPAPAARIAGEVAFALCGLLVYGILHGVVVLSVSWHGFVSGASLGNNFCDAAVACFCWFVCRLCLRKAAAVTFFLGSVRGFMVTFYRSSTLEMVQARTVPFAEQRGDFQNFFRQRCMQIVEFRRIASGSRLVVIHIHANALGNDMWRKAQIAEACDVALAKQGDADVVLAGDFNAQESDGAVTQVSALFGFVDAFVRHGSGNGATWSARSPLSHGFLRVPDHRCDYVFCKLQGRCSVGGCRVVMDKSPITSDHFGVLVDLIESVSH